MQKNPQRPPAAVPLVSDKASLTSMPPAVRSDYMRGGRHSVLKGWKPALRSERDAVSVAWSDASARAADLIHNSGWISGAIDQAVANTVGTGLRLKAMPENDQFGMSNADAQVWARQVEQRWQLWSESAYECDIEGRRTFGQMQAAEFRQWLGTGESLADITWRRRSGAATGTKVRLIPSHLLKRDSNTSERLINGVRMNRDGLPISYVFGQKDSSNMLGGTVEVRARDRYGRQKIVHVYQGVAGTVRGITPLVPVLALAKQFDQLADATLMASIIQNVFAATITGDAPTEEALAGLLTPTENARLLTDGLSPFDAWFDVQSGWYENMNLDVGANGRIAHLFPGQKMEFQSGNHPTTHYKDFALHLLREIARCLGMTYESATGDYEGATYSSVRMAVNEIFAITLARRKFIVKPFCQPIYESWLEEQIQEGHIGFPGGIMGFLSNRTAAARANWIGSPQPQADNLKTAKAHQIYRDMGVVSDEDIANDLGHDIDDVYQRRASEMKLRETYKLPEMGVATPNGSANPEEEELEEDA